MHRTVVHLHACSGTFLLKTNRKYALKSELMTLNIQLTDQSVKALQERNETSAGLRSVQKRLNTDLMSLCDTLPQIVVTFQRYFMVFGAISYFVAHFTLSLNINSIDECWSDHQYEHKTSGMIFPL